MSSEYTESIREAKEVNFDHWIEALVMVARHYRLDYSAENAKTSSAWNQGIALPDALRSIAYQLGMTLTWISHGV
ncbi:hypothetical protein ACT3RL_17890 [Halomonas sp. AOP5-CZ2-32]